MISSSNDPGGLANQMFQYAAGYAHARKMGTEFFYPEKPEAEPHRLLPQNPPYHSPPHTISLRETFNITALDSGEHGPVHSDRHHGFHYTPIPETPDLTLHGYYQSHKYFEGYEEELRKEFTFTTPTNLKVDKKTVSIHVRRSDYLQNPNYHPVCSLDYYHAAMREFRGYKFMVFSDDREWCLEWFDLPNVTVSLADTPAEDLELMSKCSHHIMANSSFSWWGVWLNPNKNKRVIAPKEWFGPGYNMWDTSDLYDPSWKLL